ncbi:hypothetical protein [Nostoc sp. FACHB-110]|uniref:hypothetical protein n=1 Tax=Nostoc sp. FACHB-110 TaxID=2692834 RepID=UPI00168330C8|nr:hypothetical protein [Nostoc sp. FACHB-110]MBD2439416.1 hypothetical protein [Nostoc sp. FACHB-110]
MGNTKPQGWYISQIFNAKTIRLTTPFIAIAGLWASILPSTAVTDAYYNNDYRACAGQLLRVGVTPQAAAQDCATALRPRDLSACVASIRQGTKIEPIDALASCSRARRPKELASCVVGVSQNTKEEVNAAVLTYCGRSLLPVTFAQCVVGLRREITLTPIQALDTCIDASERANGIATSPVLQLPIK